MPPAAHSPARPLAPTTHHHHHPHTRRPPLSSEEDGLLRESLLSGGADLEQGGGGGGGGKKRKHSWVALVGIAAQYMWPDSVTLQLRAWVCVGLVVLLRLLNLAVPVLYKKVGAGGGGPVPVSCVDLCGWGGGWGGRGSGVPPLRASPAPHPHHPPASPAAPPAWLETTLPTQPT